jgi:hypothetical protein
MAPKFNVPLAKKPSTNGLTPESDHKDHTFRYFAKPLCSKSFESLFFLRLLGTYSSKCLRAAMTEREKLSEELRDIQARLKLNRKKSLPIGTFCASLFERKACSCC